MAVLKIRLDYVTNSSSSSFVTYDLSDSEFCRYLTKRMKEMGLEYEEYSYDRPGSHVSLNTDTLYGDISCQFEDLHCSNYAPEVYSSEFEAARLIETRHASGYKQGIFVALSSHITDAYGKYLYIKMLRDVFSYKSRRYKSIGKCIEDKIKECCDLDGDTYLYGYTTVRIKDTDDWKFSSQFYKFLTDHHEMFDKTLTVEANRFCFQFYRGKTKATRFEPSRKLMDVIFVYPDKIFFGIAEGYTECEYKDDVKSMSDVDEFMSVISDFVPIDQLSDDDRRELKRLYLQDRQNDKFKCDVYMRNTD